MTLSLLLLAALVDPAALSPATKWQVEYADSMCVLSRDYGAGADKVTLALRPWPMSNETEVIVLTQGNAALVDGGRAEISLLPAGHTTKGSFSRFDMPKGAPGRIATLHFDEGALDGLAAATGVTVRLGNHEVHTVAIPGISAAMRALETCQKDLLKGWGVDPDERATLSRLPRGNPGRFFGPSVYPQEAVINHLQGRVVTVASIGVDGRVTGCAVAATSGARVLDQATCNVLKASARFSPALDMAGKPVVSHLVVPVRWVLPG
ncbi:MAG: energy transducer TonB [Pseudomonadota bacterium]